MELVELKNKKPYALTETRNKLVEVGMTIPETKEPHKLLIEDVAQVYGTDLEVGLSSEEILSRQKKYGENIIKPKKEQHPLIKYFVSLFSGFGTLLFVATIITFITYKPLGDPNPAIYNLALSLVLFTVMILQGSFNFYQEYQASNILKSFKNMLPCQTSVKRGGVQEVVIASKLTLGDIVIVSAGCKIPADLRLVEVHNLKVDNSALTGESDPVRCTSAPCEGAILEARNMLFLGTSVVEGSGVGVVVSISDSCEMGRIISSAANTTSQTPLNKEIFRIVCIITLLAILTGTAVTLGWAFWLKSDHPDYMPAASAVMNVIGVLVVYIPEGLPIAVTIGLALIAKRLCKRYNVLVTKLGTVETLGCVSLIASDKTGTLTQNKMTITSLIVGGNVHDLKSSKSQLSTGARILIRGGVLCNPARVARDTHEIVGGNGVDIALLKCAIQVGIHPLKVADCYNLLAEIPFSSTTKYAVTIHSPDKDDKLEGDLQSNNSCHFVTLKGAPEIVIKKCAWVMTDNGTSVELTSSMIEKIQQETDELATSGHRMIAIATIELNEQEFTPIFEYNTDEINFPITDLILLGVVGISDPPRAEVPNALRQCKAARVRVMMVTGDHQATAVSIARQVSIITHGVVDNFSNYFKTNTDNSNSNSNSNSNNNSNSNSRSMVTRKFNYRDDCIQKALVITGTDLQSFTDDHWDWALKYEQIVFARTTPEHKLAIVTQAQNRGHTVAVTGDGANDAPAIKKADVGVAMHSGADVARDSADIILLTNDFTALVTGIREGRLVFTNLRKLIQYLLPAGNFSELIPVIANVFLGMPLPLSTFLMIVICVCTDLFGSLAIIYEHAESDIMEHGPRDSKRDNLLTPTIMANSCLFVGVIESVSAFYIFFFYWAHQGMSASDLIFAWDFSSPDGYAGYTADELINFTNEAQSAFFVTLVVCQLGNLLSTRINQSYFHNVKQRAHNFVSDPKSYKRFITIYSFAIFSEIFWALIFTEVPFFNYYLQTAPVAAEYWFTAFGFSVALFVCQETKKLVVQRIYS